MEAFEEGDKEGNEKDEEKGGEISGRVKIDTGKLSDMCVCEKEG